MNTAASGERILSDLIWFVVVRELMTDHELGFRGKRSKKLGLAEDSSAAVIRDGYGIADLKARTELRLDPYLRSPVGGNVQESLQDHLVDRQARRFASSITEAGPDLATQQWFAWMRMLNAKNAPVTLTEMETATRTETLRQFHHDFTTRDCGRYAEAMERLCYIVLEHFLVSRFFNELIPKVTEADRPERVDSEAMYSVFSDFWERRIDAPIRERGSYMEKPEGLHSNLRRSIDGYFIDRLGRIRTQKGKRAGWITMDRTADDGEHGYAGNVERELGDDDRPAALDPERAVLDQEQREADRTFLQDLVVFTEDSRRNPLQLLILLMKLDDDATSSKAIAAFLESCRTDHEALETFLWECGYELEDVERIHALVIEGLRRKTDPIDHNFVDQILTRARPDILERWAP